MSPSSDSSGLSPSRSNMSPISVMTRLVEDSMGSVDRNCSVLSGTSSGDNVSPRNPSLGLTILGPKMNFRSGFSSLLRGPFCSEALVVVQGAEIVGGGVASD